MVWIGKLNVNIAIEHVVHEINEMSVKRKDDELAELNIRNYVNESDDISVACICNCKWQKQSVLYEILILKVIFNRLFQANSFRKTNVIL